MLLLLLLVCFAGNSLTHPWTKFHPCSLDDSKLAACLVTVFHTVFKNASIKDVASQNITSTKPLDSFYSLEIKNSTLVVGNLLFRDIMVYGIGDMSVTEASGDLKNGIFTWKGEVPRLEMLGTFEIEDVRIFNMLLDPMSGAVNFTVVNTSFTFDLEIKNETHNDLKYLRSGRSSLRIHDVGRMYMDADPFTLERYQRDIVKTFVDIINEIWQLFYIDMEPMITAHVNKALRFAIELRIFSYPFL